MNHSNRNHWTCVTESQSNLRPEHPQARGGFGNLNPLDRVAILPPLSNNQGKHDSLTLSLTETEDDTKKEIRDDNNHRYRSVRVSPSSRRQKSAMLEDGLLDLLDLNDILRQLLLSRASLVAELDNQHRQIRVQIRINGRHLREREGHWPNRRNSSSWS